MFESVDDLIADWAISHRLAWQRSYRNEEVRSIDLTLKDGRVAQSWLDAATDQMWTVHAWDRRRARFSLTVCELELKQALSNALRAVKSWETHGA